MSYRQDVERIWPELQWIEDEELRGKTRRCWELAFERSPLEPDDLLKMPFTLHVKDCPVTFMDHKRLVVHVALESAKKIEQFMGAVMPVHRDTLVAGAILADVGKLLEYEAKGGKTVQSMLGKYLRHPFTGVALAQEVGLPDAVCHVIAAHAKEGDMIQRTSEAYIVHYADFMTYEPLVKGMIRADA